MKGQAQARRPAASTSGESVLASNSWTRGRTAVGSRYRCSARTSICSTETDGTPKDRRRPNGSFPSLWPPQRRHRSYSFRRNAVGAAQQCSKRWIRQAHPSAPPSWAASSARRTSLGSISPGLPRQMPAPPPQSRCLASDGRTKAAASKGRLDAGSVGGGEPLGDAS